MVSLKEPENFDEAWDNECPETRKKWREAILKELGAFEKLKVWEPIKKEDIPVWL